MLRTEGCTRLSRQQTEINLHRMVWHRNPLKQEQIVALPDRAVSQLCPRTPRRGNTPRCPQTHKEQCSMQKCHSSRALQLVGNSRWCPRPSQHLLHPSGITEGFHLLSYTAEIPSHCAQRGNQPQLYHLEQGVHSTIPVHNS